VEIELLRLAAGFHASSRRRKQAADATPADRRRNLPLGTRLTQRY